MAHSPLLISGTGMTVARVEEISRGRRQVKLEPTAAHRVAASREVVQRVLDTGKVAYGINTGFGKLAEERIPRSQLNQLQLNLVRSHACGVGEPFSEAVVRAMLLLRANVLATGYAGCRPALVEAVLALLNAGVHPIIPSQGSVGASGDLAPLAHLALVLIGEGEARYEGQRLPGAQALAQAGLTPFHLEAKEGLALINGTQASAAVGALAVARAQRLLTAADIICALTLEALAGTDAAFEPAVHDARPHPGQRTSARRIRAMLRDSEIRESHRECSRVQDAYSIRCSAQVHGAARDSLAHCIRVLEIELNSATDNPMVFPDGSIISGGNFHGAPIAAVFDYLGATLTDIASISERRLARLVDTSMSSLPRFLVPDAGINSGFMMVQVSAAALVSECKTLAHPASVDSIPTSAGQEDHVSMSTWAARKLERIITMLEQVLAMEYLGAVQGIEFRRPLRSSELCETAVTVLREHVPRLCDDRPLAPDITKATALVSQLAAALTMPLSAYDAELD